MQDEKLPTLGCGNCGYAVRGISELKCPECGADLTRVGITRGRSRLRSALLFSIKLFGYSAVAAALAFVVFLGLQRVLPQHVERYYSIQIEPDSREYGELGLHIDAMLVQPPSSHAGRNFTVNSGSGSKNTVTMCDPGARITVTDIDIFFRARQVNGVPVTVGTAIAIDPATLKATWTDAQGKSRSSQGAFTEQDLLDCFAAHDVDISRPDVLVEATQMHAFITDFIQGKHKLTLNNYRIWAYGGSSNHSVGPPWFMPVYIGGWLLVWLIGLLWGIRRELRRAVN